jgi:adenine-specific DNA-methyltransferase
MRNESLFPDTVFEAPATEGIKYAGSKLKLLPHIIQLANKVNVKSIFDGFAGSTRVSQAFSKLGYKVISNDISVWSKVFGTCYLLCDKNPNEYKELIAHLNNVKSHDGWFTEHYGGNVENINSDSLDGFKKPWQIQNTKKLDGIREEIDKLKLNEVDRAVALTSLMLALDKVDSTLGHYVSYLREWSPRSFNPLRLEIPTIYNSSEKNEVHQSDIFNITKKIDADLAYYDPPYGSNNEKMPPSRIRYASYYHIWTSICLNDKPEVVGKAKRRADASDTIAGSVFEEFRKDENGNFFAVEAIRRLLSETKARWIILSYSSGGRATANQLNDAINECGKLVEAVEVDYRKHIMASMKWTNEWLNETEVPNREFLLLIKKS